MLKIAIIGIIIMIGVWFVIAALRAVFGKDARRTGNSGGGSGSTSSDSSGDSGGDSGGGGDGGGGGD